MQTQDKLKVFVVRIGEGELGREIMQHKRGITIASVPLEFGGLGQYAQASVDRGRRVDRVVPGKAVIAKV